MTMVDVPNIALALDLLTLPQAAAQLPIKKEDALFAMTRLVARGTIPSVKIGDQIRLRVSDLKELLAGAAGNAAARKAYELPPETLMPVCPLLGEGFDGRTWSLALMRWSAAMFAEIGKQMPAELPSGTGNDTRIEARITPEIEAIVGWQAPAGSIIAGDLPASAFRNMAELWFARQLQEEAERIIWVEGQADPKNVNVSGFLTTLYSSPASYQALTERAAAAVLQRSGFSYTKQFAFKVDAAEQMTAAQRLRAVAGQPVNVNIYLRHETLLALAKASSARIISLAF